ncbi:MAG: MFS transporter [Candidatus Nomurabacteria bacterium]|jgi:MFS family permease|nr:MFS transporter [Candidatus Nomurabacteria bacterium]
MNLWFVGAIWLYFYRVFMTDGQVGTLDSIAFLIGLLVEVPSGALADKFGRARIAKIGIALTAVGIAAQAIGGFWVILAFQIGVTAGQALISGADEALFYEKLKFKENSHKWRNLMTRGGQIALVASLSANVLGGLVYDFSPTLVWLLTGLAFLSGAVVIWGLKDEPIKRVKQTVSQSVKSYFTDIAAGFHEFIKPKFRLYIPLIITVQGLFYACGWGLLRLVLISRFEFSPFAGSIVISSCGVISILALHLMHKYSEKLHEKRVLTAITFMTIFGLIFSVFDIGWWGYVVILLFYVGEHALYPFLSEILNKQTKPEQRSTILSLASFLKILPYVALAPIIGFLNEHNSLEVFLIVWVALSGLAWLYYFVAKKRDLIIKPDFEDTEEPIGPTEIKF